jgi:hypothetical protein
MPRYPYPNVPKLPGVPQVNRSLEFPAGPPPQLGGALALGRLVLALFQKSSWGIFRDRSNEPPEIDPETGERIAVVAVSAEPPVIEPDSFRDFGFRQEWNVTSAPTEQGGFASYNKVNNPQELLIRLTKGGTLKARTDFLDKLSTIADSLDLYKVVTPERTYLSLNVSRVEVTRKEAKGAYFLAEVDVFFTEIRTVVSEYSSTASATTNARQPAATSIVNGGTKQPVELSPAQAAAAVVP